MTIQQNPIFTTLDLLRGESLTPTKAALLAGALAVWQKLSLNAAIGDVFSMTEDLHKNPSEAIDRLKLLTEELAAPAFLEAASLLERMGQKAAGEVLRVVTLQGRQGILDSFDPTDLVINASNRGEIYCLPAEVCELLIALAQLDAAVTPRSVYLPWEPGGQLLGRALKKHAMAAAEVPMMDTAMFSDITGASFTGQAQKRIQMSDPIKSPLFTEGGRLEKFDVVIACPPFNARVDFASQTKDPFGRFPDDTNSMTVLAIRHAMAQSKGKVIVVTSNSVLFSAGAERRLRRELVEAGQVEAVIALPAGLLTNAALPISILVLKPAGGAQSIRMVNCDKDRYKIRESRTRFKLDRVQDIAELGNFGFDCEDMWEGPIQAVVENDWNLMPSRYVQAPAMAALDRILNSTEMRQLGDVANIIRPIASTQDFDTVPALEVGAADIFDNGFIPTPAKEVTVADRWGRGEDQFLRPNDVVMVIKGSVGKVSIAPENTPPAGPGGWVVGQSMAILRVNEGFDPYQLVVFLRSGIGQEQIRRIVAGAAIPFLQVRELRNFQVPAGNLEMRAQAHEIITKQDSLRQQIASLEAELKTVKYEQWELPGSSAE
jgi:type I restriction enzyme M protein